jgi:hypothetical protein
MPSRPVLALLLALACVPPFVAQATGSVVGSFTMFEEMLNYHVELAVLTDTGERRVTLRSLSPHLSPEAQAILVPADGIAVGADQVDVVATGLGDLARLACKVHPAARRARARLADAPFGSNAERLRESTVDCGDAR